jgi:hypothetical protein
VANAYKQGYVGKNILGTGFDCDIVIHRGAGASRGKTAPHQNRSKANARSRGSAAISRRLGALQQADGGQQRRDALQSPRSS